IRDYPPPIPDTYSLLLRQVVNAMLVKDHNVRIPLNLLITLPKINELVRTMANDLKIGSSDDAKIYLERLLNNIDTQPAPVPIRNLILDISPVSHANIPIEPGQVDFETKNILVSRSFKSSDRSHLVRLEILQENKQHTVAILPEIVAGDGIVRILLRFEDKLNQYRGFRWVGIVNSNLDIPDLYFPGQDKVLDTVEMSIDIYYSKINQTYC
ncbi:MAG: hypothetical protein EZS28_042893, partial [Streblomastix strix]